MQCSVAVLVAEGASRVARRNPETRTRQHILVRRGGNMNKIKIRGSLSSSAHVNVERILRGVHHVENAERGWIRKTRTENVQVPRRGTAACV